MYDVRGDVRLADLPVLTQLICNWPASVARGTLDLGNVKSIEVLAVSDIQISSLEAAAIPALRELILDGCDLGAVSNSPLILARLDLSSCRVKRQDLAALLRAPTLQELGIAGTPFWAEDLAPCGQLVSLRLENVDLDGDGLAVIAALPNLAELALVKVRGLEGRDLMLLKSSPKLKELTISGVPLDDEAVDALCEIRNVERINLGAWDLGGKPPEKLEKRPNVRIVW
ncbi:MAG: hypothetical protein HYS13_11035 [Planctomycetia bacterium]|nr:hypothetical protein [Planctomycetia bacterium]